jgi:malate dehydrogenase (oxaloacetate-decarboxylating)
MEQGLTSRHDLDAPPFAIRVNGVLKTVSSVPLTNQADLGAMYMPGVAQVAEAIRDGVDGADRLSWSSNVVFVVSDGTATLGLGDTGPEAALPVMESKAAILAHFGGFNAVPLVLASRSNDEILATLKVLRPSFAAINLEDVAAPRCFELEKMLIDELGCPVMHDDQHGTAIAVLAGLIGALEVTGRQLASSRVVISGAGAAGVATAKMLLAAGAKDVVITDSHGILVLGRDFLTVVKSELAALTNQDLLHGGQAEALKGADVYIGLSPAPLTRAEVISMSDDPIIFALSNPRPQIEPKLGTRLAGVFATSRSDYPNQIINVLASPGLFKGMLRSQASTITDSMKLAAAAALARLASTGLGRTAILPDLLHPGLTDAIARAVEDAAAERLLVAS